MSSKGKPLSEHPAAAELIERVGEWHLSPREHLLLRLNARLRGLDVGDPVGAWMAYRKFHARCPVCLAGSDGR